MFVHHGCSGPVGQGIGDGALDEGLRGDSCFRRFVSGLVAWYALMTWKPDGAFSVA